MFALHHFFVVAALSGAVFPIASSAGEIEDYYELKAALVRSNAKETPKLPKWIRAEEYEPRPHFWLDRTANRPLVERNQIDQGKPDNEKPR